MIRDDAIVAALAAGLSQRRAAKRGKTSLSTVKRRLQDPAFRARIEESQGLVADLQRVYAALEDARHALHLVIDLYEDEEMFDTGAGEAVRHLKGAVAWLDEWAYLLEEECAS